MESFNEVKDQLKEVRKYLHLGSVKIDTLVFRLHYVVRSDRQYKNTIYNNTTYFLA